MPSEDNKLSIVATLNVGTSINELNKQIEEISKHPSLKKLKIKLDIDNKILQTIQQFNANLTKFNQNLSEQVKLNDQTANSFKRNTNATQNEIDAIKELNKVLDINQAMRVKIQETLDKEGKSKQQNVTLTTGNKFANVTVQGTGFEDGTFKTNTNERFVVLNPEAYEEANKKLDLFTSNAQKRFTDLRKVIGNFNPEIKRLEDELDKLNVKLKEHKLEVTSTDYKAIESQIKSLENFAKREIEARKKNQELIIDDDPKLAEQMAKLREKSMKRVQDEQNEWNEKQKQAIYENIELEKQAQKEIQLALEQTLRKRKEFEEEWNNTQDKFIQKARAQSTEQEQKETQKLIQSKLQLREQLVALRNEGRVSNEELEKVNTVIKTSRSIEELNKLEDKLEELHNISKRGIQIGQFDTLKFGSASEDELRNALKLNEAYKGLEIREASLNEVTGVWSATLRKNAKENLVLKGVLDQTTGAIYRQSEATKLATAKNLGMLQQFKIALSRVPLWMGAMTAFYFPLRQFQQGLQYIYDIDTAMTDLKKVTDATNEEYVQFIKTSAQLADSIGALTVDVIKSTTEWARLGYTMQQAQQLAKETVVYQNVGDIQNAETASQELIAAIKGFGIEVDNQGKNIAKIVDIYNEVGNKYAISSEGIGEAMQRSASSMKEAGNTIEEAVALATAANSTIQDPAKVGNALKTIAMRLRGVSEEGEDLSNLVPTLEKKFQAIGLTLQKSDGSFKNTYEIFKDLSTVWKNLNDLQRSDILEMVAGKLQGNIAASIIQNFSDAEGALQAALNSTGSAARENEKYLDSIQGKVNQFKNSVVNFWNETIDSDAIKSLVGTGTVLVNTLTLISDKLGLLPAIMGSVGAGAILMSKDFRKSAISMNILSAGIKGITISLKGLKIAFRSLVASTIVGAFFVGLGIIVEKLTNRFIEAKNTQKEFTESIQNDYDTFKENISQIENLAEVYSELSNKQNLSTEEQNKFNQIRQQLVQFMPEVVQGYDEEGNTIYATATQLNDLVKKYKEANYEKARYLSNTLAENSKKDAKEIEKLSDKLKDLKDKYNEAITEFNAKSFIKSFIEEIKNADLDPYSEEYQKKIQELHDGVQKIFDNANIFVNEPTFTASVLIDFGNITKQIEDARSKYGNLDKDIDNVNQEILQHQQNFVNGFQAYNETLINDIGLTDKNAKSFLDNLASGFVESNNITKDNYGDIIYQYRNFSSEVATLIKEGKLDLSSVNTVEGLLNIKKELSSLQVKYKDLQIPVQVVDKLIEDLKNTTNQFGYSAANAGDKTKDLEKAFNDAINILKPLNQALSDVSQGQSLSADTIADLIIKYPELVSAVKKTADGYTIEKNAIESVREEQLKSQIDIIKAQSDITDNTFTEIQKRMAYFGFEIQTIEDLKTSYKELKQIQESQEKSSKGFMQHPTQGFYSKKDVDEVTNLSENYLKVLELIELMKEVGSKSDSSSSSNLTQIFPTYKQKIEDLNSQVDDLNQAIMQTERLMQQADKTENLQEKIRLEQEYSKQLNKRKDIIHQIADQLRLMRDKEVLPAFDRDFSDFRQGRNLEDITQVEIQNYSDFLEKTGQKDKRDLFNFYIEVFQQIEKGITDQQDSWWDNLFKIFDTNTNIVAEKIDNLFKNLDNRVKPVDKVINDLNNKVELLDENDSNYNSKKINLISQIIEQYRIMQSILKTNLEQLKEEQGTLQEGTEAWEKAQQEIENTQEKLDNIPLSIKRANDELKKIQNTVAKDVIDAYKKAYETMRDVALKSIEEQMKAEDERHKQFSENLDEEMRQFDENINSMMKTLDRQSEKEDYEEQLKKLLSERDEIVSKITKLSLSDDIADKARRVELEEELANKKDEINKLQRNRTRDLEKQTLQDLLDNKKKEIDSVKEAEDKKYESEKERLDQLKNDTEEYWNSVIENDKTYTKIQEDILNKHLDNIIVDLTGFQNSIIMSMKLIGDGIANNLINNLEEAKKSLYDLNNIRTSISLDNFSLSQENYNQKKKDHEQYIANKIEWNNIKQETGSNDSARQKELNRINEELRKKWGFADYTMDDIISGNIAKFDTGGYTGKWGNGGKLGILHEKELIFNKIDTSKILKVANIADNIIQGIKQFDFSKIKQNRNVSSNQAVNNKITIHIDSVNGTKQEAENFAKVLAKRLTAQGVQY